jgi:hypothetical protein
MSRSKASVLVHKLVLTEVSRSQAVLVLVLVLLLGRIHNCRERNIPSTP